MLPLVIAALFAGANAATVGVPPRPRKPSVLRDAALAAGASAAVAFVKPDIRRALFRDARFRNVVENFAFPVAQVRAGTRRDSDPFWVNHIAHPGSFAVEALYLKHQGYGDGQAFLFTQVHSVLWEFAIEGCAFEPSGKDLVADAVGAAAAIWIVHPALRRWTMPATPVQVAFRPLAGGIAFSVAGRF